MDKKRQEQMAMRKQMLDELEQKLAATRKPEDSFFFYHPNEDHIVLSHALFWVMTAPLQSKLQWSKNFLLLRQFQEEMLEAYLTESEEFEDLLHFCTVCYETLPYTIGGAREDQKSSKACHKLIAMAIVAGGYGGDMEEERMYDLLDDIDFHYNKVKCPLIEKLLPWLYKKVEEEMNTTLATNQY